MDHNTTSTSRRFSFHGQGGDLFGKLFGNAFLCAITLGIYYPWAKADLTQYYYRHTELEGSNFTFHGTGKEMFLGFLKTVLGFIVLVFAASNLISIAGPIATVVVVYLIVLGLIPFALVDSLRYNLSRSSWRGVHFSYTGTAANMASVFFPGVILTILTVGFYSAWFSTAMRKEVTNNTKFGSNVEFEYIGTGGELFKMMIKGYLLTIVTLGIYSFWWMADMYNYYYDHTLIHQKGRTARFKATVTGGGLLKMFLVDMLLLIVTLGLATAWLTVKNLRYIAENLYIEGDIDLDQIEAGESVYANATGEEMLTAMS